MAEVALTGTELRRILTPREHQVLVLLARERGSHEVVARALTTHERTVREAEASAREKIARALERKSVRRERDTTSMPRPRVKFDERVARVRGLLADGPMRGADLRDALGIDGGYWSADVFPQLRAAGVVEETGERERNSPMLRLVGVESEPGAGQDGGEVSPESEPSTVEPDDSAGPAADQLPAPEEDERPSPPWALAGEECEICRQVIDERAPVVRRLGGVVEHAGECPAPAAAPEAWRELVPGEIGIDVAREAIDGNGHGPRGALGPEAFGPGPIARILGKMIGDLVGYAVLSEAEAAPLLRKLAIEPQATGWRDVRHADPAVGAHFEYLAVLFDLAREAGAPQHVFDRIERLMIAGPPGAGDGEGRDTTAPVRG